MSDKKQAHRTRFAVVAMANMMSLMIILLVGLSDERVKTLSTIIDSFLWIQATIVLTYLGVSTVTKVASAKTQVAEEVKKSITTEDGKD